MAKVADLGGALRGGFDEEFVDGLRLGDAIRFFLDAKRAGGRSPPPRLRHCSSRFLAVVGLALGARRRRDVAGVQ